MLGYLDRAVPLEDLIKAGTADHNSADASEIEANRRFALQVEDIRNFATNELGLKESKNYTKYVELDRDYLAAVVSACAKDSFTGYQWWFPIIGNVPYKGFFNIEDARKERTKLEKKDLDVWIRGVDAFSTLGWFEDPLYSYMKNYPLQDLANLIIHESLHATVYLNNQSQFNEELAEFVGTEGARLYMLSLPAREPLDFLPQQPENITEAGLENDAEAKAADNAAFISFIQDLTAKLNTMYNDQSLGRDEKLIQKAVIIGEAQSDFRENYDNTFKTENYRSFSEMQINNAFLDLYRLYYERNDWFKELYEKSGSDLKAFINAAKTLKGKGDPRTELEKALGLM